jgi:hypothetical protein
VSCPFSFKKLFLYTKFADFYLSLVHPNKPIEPSEDLVVPLQTENGDNGKRSINQREKNANAPVAMVQDPMILVGENN